MMCCGFRKEMVTALLALPLVFAAGGCSGPQEQEATDTALQTTTASVTPPAAPAAPAPAEAIADSAAEEDEAVVEEDTASEAAPSAPEAPAAPTPAPSTPPASGATQPASPAPATPAPAPPAASSPPTAQDGVYTTAQANRGQSDFLTFCSACHNTTEFTGSHFALGWGSQTVGDLHQFVTQMMPMDSPGSLTAQQYADIMAFFISQNGFPAGDTELPSSNAALMKIRFVPAGS